MNQSAFIISNDQLLLPEFSRKIIRYFWFMLFLFNSHIPSCMLSFVWINVSLIPPLNVSFDFSVMSFVGLCPEHTFLSFVMIEKFLKFKRSWPSQFGDLGIVRFRCKRLFIYMYCICTFWPKIQSGKRFHCWKPNVKIKTGLPGNLKHFIYILKRCAVNETVQFQVHARHCFYVYYFCKTYS